MEIKKTLTTEMNLMSGEKNGLDFLAYFAYDLASTYTVHQRTGFTYLDLLSKVGGLASIVVLIGNVLSS